ncbi:hypothetical protein ACF1B0_22440 [Streptomyces anandii]|uniref:hypothetical protein n=1 Tax=Streptomyces anandii TaxID=285454 RepID=UPI0036F84FF4
MLAHTAHGHLRVAGPQRLQHPAVPGDDAPAPQGVPGGRRARAALQDSCRLRNGPGVTRPPRELITAVADYVELPGAGTCCGAAGTYGTLRPEDSFRDTRFAR